MSASYIKINEVKDWDIYSRNEQLYLRTRAHVDASDNLLHAPTVAIISKELESTLGRIKFYWWRVGAIWKKRLTAYYENRYTKAYASIQIGDTHYTVDTVDQLLDEADKNKSTEALLNDLMQAKFSDNGDFEEEYTSTYLPKMQVVCAHIQYHLYRQKTLSARHKLYVDHLEERPTQYRSVVIPLITLVAVASLLIATLSTGIAVAIAIGFLASFIPNEAYFWIRWNCGVKGLLATERFMFHQAFEGLCVDNSDIEAGTSLFQAQVSFLQTHYHQCKQAIEAKEASPELVYETRYARPPSDKQQRIEDFFPPIGSRIQKSEPSSMRSPI